MIKSIGLWLIRWKEAFDALSAIATVIAVVIGALWSIFLFKRHRRAFPKAVITQTISHQRIDKKLIFVRVTAVVENKGETLITLQLGFTRLLLVAPCDDQLINGVRCKQPRRVERGGSRIDWPLLEQVNCRTNPPREIEPSETDEIHFDFIIDADIQTIVAHTQLKNHAKGEKEFVWDRATVYHLNAFPILERECTMASQQPKQTGQSQNKQFGEQTKVEPVPPTVTNRGGSATGDFNIQSTVDLQPPPVTPKDGGSGNGSSGK